MPWETEETFPYDEVAEFALELGRLAATRITPETLASFREDVYGQMRVMGEQPYYVAWLEIIAAGAEEVARVFTDTTERGRYLRAVAPLRAFRTAEESRMMRRDVFTRRA